MCFFILSAVSCIYSEEREGEGAKDGYVAFSYHIRSGERHLLFQGMIWKKGILSDFAVRGRETLGLGLAPPWDDYYHGNPNWCTHMYMYLQVYMVCHMVLWYVTWYHGMSHGIMGCHMVLWDVTWYYGMSHGIMRCHICIESYVV